MRHVTKSLRLKAATLQTTVSFSEFSRAPIKPPRCRQESHQEAYAAKVVQWRTNTRGVPSWDSDKRQWKRHLRDVELYLNSTWISGTERGCCRIHRACALSTLDGRHHGRTRRSDCRCQHLTKALGRALGMEDATNKDSNKGRATCCGNKSDHENSVSNFVRDFQLPGIGFRSGGIGFSHYRLSVTRCASEVWGFYFKLVQAHERVLQRGHLCKSTRVNQVSDEVKLWFFMVAAQKRKHQLADLDEAAIRREGRT